MVTLRPLSEALTNHGSMYGVIPFYAAAKKAGFKPIIGVEATSALPGKTQKVGKLDADCHHMILLAKDDVGYRSLLAHDHRAPRRPRLEAAHRQGALGQAAGL